VAALRGLAFNKEAEAAAMTENDCDVTKPVATLNFWFSPSTMRWRRHRQRHWRKTCRNFFPWGL